LARISNDRIRSASESRYVAHNKTISSNEIIVIAETALVAANAVLNTLGQLSRCQPRSGASSSHVGLAAA
jgi:hypothetical protein